MHRPQLGAGLKGASIPTEWCNNRMRALVESPLGVAVGIGYGLGTGVPGELYTSRMASAVTSRPEETSSETTTDPSSWK